MMSQICLAAAVALCAAAADIAAAPRPLSGERFTLAPAQPPALQAYHNTSHWSWGGGLVHWSRQEGGDGLFHLFASGMTNGCGLHAWSSNTHIFHATSATVEGPYAFSDVALPVLATAPGPARAS